MAPDISSTKIDGFLEKLHVSERDGKINDKAKTVLQERLNRTNATILFPNSDGYEENIQRCSDTCKRRAAAVVLVTDEKEVQAVVNTCRENAVPFVVAGGRHSTSPSSAIEDGIVIDLRKMRSVTIDAEKKIITAQGGAIWEDVDVEAAKYGLATPGGMVTLIRCKSIWGMSLQTHTGTVNHTGIGGLTLGGGSGWLSGRYGLAIDNLLSVKMVLADGSYVTASSHSHPDLFWAVRGAGQNFGVVTEFVYKAHDQGPVYSGMLVFTPDKLDKVVEFANWHHENHGENEAMGIAFSQPPNAPVVSVMVLVFFNGNEEEGKKYFAPLLELEPLVNMAATMPYEKVNEMLNSGTGFGGRKIFGGSNVVLPLDKRFVHSIYEEFSQFTMGNERMSQSLLMFELVPFKKVSSVPIEETAHGNRGDYYNVGTLFKWYDPAQDEMVRMFNRKLNGRIKEEAGVKKSMGVGVYSNYLCECNRPSHTLYQC